MEKIYTITLWVYVVSMVGAALFTTSRMHEIQEAWQSTDPQYRFAPHGMKQFANFFIASLFVFIPLVNTVTALTLVVTAFHKIMNRE